MARRIVGIAAILLCAAAAAGCSSAEPRYYTLDAMASPGAPATHASVLIGPVVVPGSVDQPQFVVQVASNQVEVEEFQRWAAPLNESIARAIAGDLSSQLDTPNVATGPLADFRPDYRVSVEVRRFESVRGATALIDAVWVVRDVRNGQTRSGRTIARDPVQGNGFDALAAAHSRALVTVSADIAAAIRAENTGQS